MYWLAIIIATICTFWALIIEIIGGKIWVTGYWIMFFSWFVAIIKSKQKRKWGVWFWSAQILMCLIAFLVNIDRAVVYTLWSIKGFAP